MNTFISILKGFFTIVWKGFILCLYGAAKILEITSKAIGDSINENLKSN